MNPEKRSKSRKEGKKERGRKRKREKKQEERKREVSCVAAIACLFLCNALVSYLPWDVMLQPEKRFLHFFFAYSVWQKDYFYLLLLSSNRCSSLCNKVKHEKISKQ